MSGNRLKQERTRSKTRNARKWKLKENKNKKKGLYKIKQTENIGSKRENCSKSNRGHREDKRGPNT
jgi:hypothetical protein